MLKMSRVWAMPNKWTFQIPPIADLLARYVGDGKGWIDPFAGMTSPAEFTNDLNPDSPAKFHMDALRFLESLKGEYRGCIFDPPYSPRQVKECYDAIGLHMQQDDALLGFKRGQYKAAANQILHAGATVISCGWNTVGMGQGLGYQVVEILLVCHGSDHNDTIVTVERKVQAGMDLSNRQEGEG